MRALRTSLLFAFLASCAHVTTIDRSNAHVTIEYGVEDTAAMRHVSDALPTAIERLRRWGGLPEPVTIRILPSHAALEESTQRIGYPWLRAWTRYGTIDLQSPRTWPERAATDNQLLELLSHELTHCLMYQRIGTPLNWMWKEPPLWFREGMASVTANQGYRRLSLVELRRYVKEHPGANPLADAETLYKSYPDLAYGIAHHAFEFLLANRSPAVIAPLFDAMRGGSDFSEALRKATGESEAEFAAEFVAELKITQ